MLEDNNREKYFLGKKYLSVLVSWIVILFRLFAVMVKVPLKSIFSSGETCMEHAIFVNISHCKLVKT
jgi:hypothetical protein